MNTLKYAPIQTLNYASQEAYFQAQAELEYTLENMIYELKHMALRVCAIRSQLYEQNALDDWHGCDIEDKILHLCATLEQKTPDLLTN